MICPLVRYSDLKTRYGIPWSRIHIDRLEKKGEFPQRVHLGRGTIGWVEGEIAEFVSAKLNNRQPVAA